MTSTLDIELYWSTLQMAIRHFTNAEKRSYLINERVNYIRQHGSLLDEPQQEIVKRFDREIESLKRFETTNVSKVIPKREIASPLSRIDKPTLEENKKVARDYLEYLSGYNLHKEKIMSNDEFKRLKNHVIYLIEFQSLPKKIKPIQQTKISSDCIRYTLYQIQFHIYGKKNPIRDTWIDFLHQVFRQFQDIDKNTTKRKLASRPKSYLGIVK